MLHPALQSLAIAKTEVQEWINQDATRIRYARYLDSISQLQQVITREQESIAGANEQPVQESPEPDSEFDSPEDSEI